MTGHSNTSRISRRAMLKSLAVATTGLSLPQLSFSAPIARPLRERVKRYLEACSRSDGGYAWSSETESHLNPTFGVIGCYHVLHEIPPNKASVAEFVRRHHPSALKKLEQEHREFDFQQIQSLIWLGENASNFREQVSAWKRPMAYKKQYEQHGWPIFSHEILSSFIARALLRLPLNDIPEYIRYLDGRRRANGSFNSTPVDASGDGNVLNTWYGLQALKLLGRSEEKKEETITWLHACQLPGGGFTHQPQPQFAPVDDVAYTWAAVRALALFGASPANPSAALAYIASLANADGGFADKPGWLSNPLATYYALDTLAALGQLDNYSVKLPRARRAKASLPRGLKVFSIQIEAHGNGSPADAVELARSLRIHLLGAKNAAPEWLVTGRAIADARKVPVRFFVANEEYGTWVDMPGLGIYSHTSDIIAPAGSDFGPSLANRGVVSWAKFREQRLGPLQIAGGRLIWQFGENEELMRLYLDDSAQRGGYAAISTFHFGNPDFANTEPFLQRYRGKIPFIALQDAHGKEPWWFADMTSGFRTLFLAAEPTWEGWLKALENNWVVPVRSEERRVGKECRYR